MATGQEKLHYQEELAKARGFKPDVWKLKRNYKEEFETNKKIKENLETNLKSNETKLEKLLDLLIEGKIDDEIYNNKKEDIQGNINIYKGKLSDLDFKKDTTIDIVEDVFEFITLVKDKFNNGDLKTKKAILTNLGENFKLLDGILCLDSHPFLQPIQKNLPEIKRIYKGLELTKKGISLLETNTNFSFISLWSALVKEVRNEIANYNGYIKL